MTGCILLYARWESFPARLSFFPNVVEVFFASSDTEFIRCSPWERPNSFFITEIVWVNADGSVPKPTPFYHIDDFTYTIVRNLETGWQEQGARPLAVGGDGQPDIPQVFLQSLRHLVLRPGRGKHDDWLTILEHRTAASIRTDSLVWGMGIREERSVLPRLALAVPSDLRSLQLESGSDSLSVSLDTFVEIIDTKHFPNLERLTMRLYYFQGIMRDKEARRMGLTNPKWLTNHLPSDL